MKKTILTLFIILFVGVITYFYYVKPQREVIKLSTQNCIDKTMVLINTEAVKDSPNPYKSSEWFIQALKTQDREIDKCLNNYNTILFSPSEATIVKLNLTSTLNKQSSDIASYTKKIEAKIEAQKKEQDRITAQQLQKQNTQKACLDRKTMKAQYESCVSAEYKKDSDINKLMIMLSANTDASNNICVQKYNYEKLGVSDFSCMMIGIY